MSSYILHIETTTSICSVALSKNGELCSELRAGGPQRHISELSILIDQLLKGLQLSYDRLAAVAVSSGPGSYTGLRVGFATAKGLCLGLSIPLIAVDSLQSLALAIRSAYKPASGLIIPMIDARRMEVYCAHYTAEGSCIQPPHAHILSSPEVSRWIHSYETVYLGGNGASKLGAFEHELNAYNKLKFSDVECDARHLISIAWKHFTNGQFANLAYCEPMYLKPPNITKPKKPGLF